LIGIDLDPANLELAREALRPADAGSLAFFNTNFAGLPRVLAQAGVERADGILADLGVRQPADRRPGSGILLSQARPARHAQWTPRAESPRRIWSTPCRDMNWPLH